MNLTEYELAELKQGCGAGQQLWSIAVTFDENNPMNSVGGIQVFAALKACGTVLKTIPDFDALYEDEFHKDVIYFVATTNTAEELEDTAFLDDVTLSVDAKNLDNAVASDSGATESAPAPQAAAPAPEANPAESAPQPAPAPAVKKSKYF